MDYLESAEGIEITKARALRELAKHGVTDPESISLFLSECGDREIYDASKMFAWLGY